MNNGRYVNRDIIIKRVQQYYGLDASGKDVDDFIYDGLRGIGTFNMYDLIATSGINDMPDPIKITDYRGVLPNNIEFPIQAFDSETQIPMLCKNTVFRTDYNYYFPSASSKSYELKRNHIFTNIEEHKVVLVYLGFPLDDSGRPLIPDDENYLKAITAYVAKSIAFPLNLKGQVSNNALLKMEQEYFSSADGAYELEIPNTDQLEMLKNQMLQMLPDYSAYLDNFTNTGLRHKVKYT